MKQRSGAAVIGLAAGIFLLATVAVRPLSNKAPVALRNSWAIDTLTVQAPAQAKPALKRTAWLWYGLKAARGLGW